MFTIIFTMVLNILILILAEYLAKPLLELAIGTIPSWVTSAFFVENLFSVNIGDYFDLEGLCYAVFIFAMTYLVLAFIVRIIQVYFAWSNGDPETSPITVVIGFIKALIVMLIFGICYEYFVQIIYEMYTTLLDSGFNGGISEADIEDATTSGVAFSLVGAIVYFVVALEILLIYIDVLTRGVQLLILRLGAVFAAIGLLNADGGVFKGYLKKYIQNGFTILIEIFLAELSVILLINNQFILALITVSVALKGVSILSDLLQSNTGSLGSGGLLSAASSAGSASRLLSTGMHFASKTSGIVASTGSSIKNIFSSTKSSNGSSAGKSSGISAKPRGSNSLGGKSFTGIRNIGRVRKASPEARQRLKNIQSLASGGRNNMSAGRNAQSVGRNRNMSSGGNNIGSGRNPGGNSYSNTANNLSANNNKKKR